MKYTYTYVATIKCGKILNTCLIRMNMMIHMILIMLEQLTLTQQMKCYL